MQYYEVLKNLRIDRDKSQKEIAELLQTTQTYYSKYELGKINIPVDVLIKLADYYEVSIDYLVGRTKIKKWDA